MDNYTDIQCSPPPVAVPPQAAESIVAADISKQFGKVTAVDHLNLLVREGEFFGFLGPNGAGKSTTIRMLCGLLRPDSGGVRIAGYEAATHLTEIKRVIGVLPDEPNLYDRLTGREYVTFAGQMYGLGKEEASRRTKDLLDLMQMTEDPKKLIVDYSLGTRKKVALAAALIHRPRVLFMDEPFNGIDPISVRSLRDVLLQLTARGVTIFISSHVMEVIEKLCTRIAVITRGKIVGVGTVEQLRAQSESGINSSLEDVFIKLVQGEVKSSESLEWL